MTLEFIEKSINKKIEENESIIKLISNKNQSWKGEEKIKIKNSNILIYDFTKDKSR